MQKIIEKLYLFETSDYYKMKDPLLFYDISELGWARYLSAHINYLTKNGKHVAICTNKSREVLYRDFATEIFNFPDEILNIIKDYDSNGNDLLYSKDHNIKLNPKCIIDILKKLYKDYTIITNYSHFPYERIFEPYHHSDEIKNYCEKSFRKCIIIFPRFRGGIHSIRNLPEDKFIYIINFLCENFPNLDIISIGRTKGSYNINNNYNNYYNLIENEDSLEIMISLCNMKKVITSFGVQTGIMNIATLCKSPSFIIGHDKNRVNYENWTGSDIHVYNSNVTKNGYYIDNYEDLLYQLSNYIKKQIKTI